MTRIRKFKIDFVGQGWLVYTGSISYQQPQAFQFPADARILHFDLGQTRDHGFVWVVADWDQPLVTRQLKVYATNEVFLMDAKHISTVKMTMNTGGIVVLHLFEVFGEPKVARYGI